MQSNAFTRSSGLALFVGGILYSISGLFRLDNNDPQSAFSPLWMPLQLIITAFYALSIPGLIGLHSRQKHKTGRLGRIGIILAIIGAALTFLASLAFAFVIPAISTQQIQPQSPAELISTRGPLSWISLLLPAFLFAFVPGTVLTGLATVWAGVLPRLAGLLVSVGMTLLVLGEASPQASYLRIIGGVLAGLGFAWLGYALWSEKNTS